MDVWFIYAFNLVLLFLDPGQVFLLTSLSLFLLSLFSSTGQDKDQTGSYVIDNEEKPLQRLHVIFQ